MIRSVICLAGVLLGLASVGRAQMTQPAPVALGGVAITADGLLQMRKVAPAAAARREGDASLTYVSLAKVLEQLRASQGKLNKELRYLQGLTRIDYLFVYPGPGGDIVFAGPSEPIRDENPLQATSAMTGRPVLQVEDLIVALRCMESARHDTVFGCSLDLAPNATDIAAEIGRRYANAPSAQVAQALKEALGPQTVRILGVPSDSRVALAMVTADYRLKRIAMGVEPLPGVGNALSSGLASNRVWFEPAYDAIGVSEDGLCYQVAGPRLKVLAGAHNFEATGATPSATAFAKRFSTNMMEVAGRIDALADLQNVTDLFLIAALIRRDELAARAGVDFSWVLRKENYKTASLTIPRTAETIVSNSGAMITEGGVFMPDRMFAVARRGNRDRSLSSRRARPEVSWFLTRPNPKS